MIDCITVDCGSEVIFGQLITELFLVVNYLSSNLQLNVDEVITGQIFAKSNSRCMLHQCLAHLKESVRLSDAMFASDWVASGEETEHFKHE